MLEDGATLSDRVLPQGAQGNSSNMSQNCRDVHNKSFDIPKSRWEHRPRLIDKKTQISLVASFN